MAEPAWHSVTVTHFLFTTRSSLLAGWDASQHIMSAEPNLVTRILAIPTMSPKPTEQYKCALIICQTKPSTIHVHFALRIMPIQDYKTLNMFDQHQ